jgi:hypothetical protein
LRVDILEAIVEDFSSAGEFETFDFQFGGSCQHCVKGQIRQAVSQQTDFHRNIRL